MAVNQITVMERLKNFLKEVDLQNLSALRFTYIPYRRTFILKLVTRIQVKLFFLTFETIDQVADVFLVWRAI